MNKQFEVQEVNQVTKKVEVVVLNNEVEKQMQKTLVEKAKEIEIKGFRKGKAPVSLIKERFENHILEEVLNKLIDSCVSDILKENFADAIDVNNVVIIQNGSKNSDLKFSFNVEILPKFDLKNYEGIEIEVERELVTQHKEGVEWQRLISDHIKYENVDGRHILERDDVLEGIGHLYIGGEKIKDTNNPDKEDDSEVKLSLVVNEYFIQQDLFKKAVGLDITKLPLEIEGEFDFDGQQGREVSNVKYVFNRDIKLTHRIEPKPEDTIPENLAKQFEITEESDKNFGKVKEILNSYLKKALQEIAELRAKDEIVVKIGEPYDFEIPESMLYQRMRNFLSSHIDPKYVNNMPPKTIKTFFDMPLGKEVTTILRSELVVSAISKKEEIKIDNMQELILQAMRSDLNQYPQDRKKIIEFYSSQKGYELVYSQAVKRKTVDLLFSKANVTYKDVEKLTRVKKDMEALFTPVKKELAESSEGDNIVDKHDHHVHDEHCNHGTN